MRRIAAQGGFRWWPSMHSAPRCTVAWGREGRRREGVVPSAHRTRMQAGLCTVASVLRARQNQQGGRISNVRSSFSCDGVGKFSSYTATGCTSPLGPEIRATTGTAGSWPASAEHDSNNGFGAQIDKLLSIAAALLIAVDCNRGRGSSRRSLSGTPLDHQLARPVHGLVRSDRKSVV